MSGLITELKRRNVFRVAIAYVVVAWLTLQVIDILIPMLALPDWVSKFLLLIIIVGFPFAMLFAWAFEITPEGLKRDKDVDRTQSVTPQTGRKLDRMIIVVLVAAVGFLLINEVMEDKSAGPASVETSARSPDPASVGETIPATEISIAVLPFQNMSDDASNEYFSDGISEELLNALTRVTELRVASRTSSFSFKDSKTPIPEIAAQLKVNHILEGSVRKVGNKVRITAQLIKVETDSHLWSDTYDRELNDIFAIQAEIAENIVAALTSALGTTVASTPVIKPSTDNLEAYELYLKGKQLLALRGATNLQKADALFDQAVAIDENFADAWAAIAKTNGLLPGYLRTANSESYIEKSDRAIDRALTLDPDNTVALMAKGMNANSYHNQWDEAEEAFQHVLRLTPNDPEVHNFYGDYRLRLMDLEGAERHERRAMELDVLAAVHARDYSVYLIAAEKFDDAVDYSHRAIALGQNPTDNADQLFWSQLSQRDFTAARDTLERIATMPDTEHWLPLLWAAWYAHQGDLENARPWFQKSKGLAIRGGLSPTWVAAIAARMGDIDTALELLERAYEYRDYYLGAAGDFNLPEDISMDPRWLAFWQKPGLKELIEIRRVNLAEQSTG